MASNSIGCAGWSIASKDHAEFPADGSHLERYSAVFNAVEINSSFYKPHQASTYERWGASVPAGFRFSVKLPRTVTQYKRLAGAGEEVARFAAEAGALGDKLGCVLVQLPPSLQLDVAVADAFFAGLRAAVDPAGPTIACEARHASWFGADGSALLRQHGITRVLADPRAGQPGPHEATADTVYLRLHGSPHIYYSSYPDDYLRTVAHQLAGRDGWCIFDNTAEGAAIPNALALKAMLQK
ncbi:DUF72 domain-containing protein [Rugamonas sp.]|uniref:DUF72 domain-containing protein n=1 Tax=Rugamonas sp. TaxID=1926287 RepID=UPI0025EC112A|nr:DUF72 domain-containing protein [Rugamonas sp.]